MRWFALFSLGLFGCTSQPPMKAESHLAEAAAVQFDEDWLSCADRVEAIKAQTAVPGAEAFDKARIQFLGRARGEPVVFVRTPRPTPTAELNNFEQQSRQQFETGRPGGRVVTLRERYKSNPESLRKLLLREGYAYFDDPIDGHWFARRVSLPDLFSDERIYLQRGERTFELVRQGSKRYPRYVHVSGPLSGEPEVVLFGDRISKSLADLEHPLHRDIAAVARRARVDRIEVVHHAADSMVVRLMRPAQSVTAVLAPQGASLGVVCIAEPAESRVRFEHGHQAREQRAKVRTRLAKTIDDFQSERPEFDRPRGVEGPDRDGELRPHWMGAYLSGRHFYEVDEETYPVFLPDGRPNPPQVCVDFVLNLYERSTGEWFSRRGEKPSRTDGTLDFDEFDVANRRGVLGFGEFAESHPKLFEFRRFEDKKRVPFAKREAFFAFLQQEAQLEPGDIVTIQGVKSDGRVHQHAIFVEDVDPITGFPYGLADKLGGSYRGTWEDIMSEAPKRSVLYRARPTAFLWNKMGAAQTP